MEQILRFVFSCALQQFWQNIWQNSRENSSFLICIFNFIPLTSKKKGQARTDFEAPFCPLLLCIFARRGIKYQAHLNEFIVKQFILMQGFISKVFTLMKRFLTQFLKSFKDLYESENFLPNSGKEGMNFINFVQSSMQFISCYALHTVFF